MIGKEKALILVTRHLYKFANNINVTLMKLRKCTEVVDRVLIEDVLFLRMIYI